MYTTLPHNNQQTATRCTRAARMKELNCAPKVVVKCIAQRSQRVERRVCIMVVLHIYFVGSCLDVSSSKAKPQASKQTNTHIVNIYSSHGIRRRRRRRRFGVLKVVSAHSRFVDFLLGQHRQHQMNTCCTPIRLIAITSTRVTSAHIRQQRKLCLCDVKLAHRSVQRIISWISVHVQLNITSSQLHMMR